MTENQNPLPQINQSPADESLESVPRVESTFNREQPQPTTVPASNPNQPPSMAPKMAVKKTNFPTLLVAILVLIILGGLFAFGYQNFFSNRQATAPSGSTEPSQPDQSAGELSSNQQLVFSKDPNNTGELEAWSINPDGSGSKQLDLPAFKLVYKRPASDLVFFIQEDEINQLGVKDLKSGKTTEYPLIQHPKDGVTEHIDISNADAISPDGSFIVYHVLFTEACPAGDPPAGAVGGKGPCAPDPDPNFLDGYYLYDLKTQKNTYISELAGIAGWDTKNNNLYFLDQSMQSRGLYLVDLTKKEKKLIEKADMFGFGAFPFLNSDQIVLFEGEPGDGNEKKSLSQLSVKNMKTQTKEIIASDVWAVIQPFAKISPDEKKFISSQTRIDASSRQTISSLYVYDLTTKENKKIAPDTNKESFSINGVWIDNDTFITYVNTIDEGEFVDVNNYLARINVNTGEIKALTEKNEVYKFNNY